LVLSSLSAASTPGTVIGWLLLPPPNFAFGAVLLGTALVIVATPAHPRRLRRLVPISVLLVVAIAVFTLWQHITGTSLFIDELLFRGWSGAGPYARSGRMAISSAVALLLLSLAFQSLFDLRHAIRGQFLAIIAFFLSYFSLIAHLYGIDDIYGAARESSMSAPTAVICLFLALSLLCLRCTREPLRLLTTTLPGSVMARRLFPAALLLPVFIGVLRLRGEIVGLYDSRFGLAIITIANIATFSLLVLHTARRINTAERRSSAAHHRLTRSESQYRSVVESLPQIIWTAGTNGSCDFVNGRWCFFTGSSFHDALGHGWLQFVHPDDVASAEANWSAAVASRTPMDTEYRLRFRDASYRWVRALATPMLAA
ncbi:MAG: PAS domain-containing protein, partial [Rhodospirillales bacterium]|nr:PAS domain-containing protein [Rhodospirillales bacterium]